MVKIIDKKMTITGENNEYELRIVETKSDGRKLFVTENMSAADIKAALDHRLASKTNLSNQVLQAREELKLYEEPKTIGELYSVFKVLMKLSDKRRGELKTGVANLMKDVTIVDKDVLVFKQAYGKAKQYLKANKPELLEPKIEPKIEAKTE